VVCGIEIAEQGFGAGAAAEAPRGSEDLGGDGFFDEICGVEFGVQGGLKGGVFAAFFGFDEIFPGVEAEHQVVLGGGCFSGGAARSGGMSGVSAIGVDPGLDRHVGLGPFEHSVAGGIGDGYGIWPEAIDSVEEILFLGA
jgi:hypothetical protein